MLYAKFLAGPLNTARYQDVIDLFFVFNNFHQPFYTFCVVSNMRWLES